MDLVSRCKDKLAYFRIKELKDVLTELCLARQGKKQELVDRILFVLSDEKVAKLECRGRKYPIGTEGIAKIIDDTYRKMQIHGATNIASKRQSDSDINNLKLKEENGGSLQLATKVRCPCGNSLRTGRMIQCNDPKCGVLQHFSCVIIPEKPMEGDTPDPPQFYCEICRLTRADPFWVTVEHPVLPVKLTISDLPTDGTNPMQKVEKIFQLKRADLLQKPEYEVQAWCILLNDKVPFRMQWPQCSDLQINGVPIRTTNRPGSQLLGANGRDDGALITTCTREGINNISLSGCDARIFCFGVRIGKRCTVQEVLDRIPKEQDGERFEDALTRVCRCIGGGNAAENADSDSDLEVVADSVTINLRCPMSGSRMKTAGRFKPCAHMACFDLETFVELNQRSRKWQCPICLKNYSLENVIIDPYFNRITTKMRDCGEDVTEIDMKPDGSWRAKNENEQPDVGQWHFPDGSLCTPMDEVKPVFEALKQIKQDELSEGHCSLRLGIRKNSNGIWEVKPEDMHSLSSGNHGQGGFEKHCPKVMLMSSCATGSYRDGEDPSVNQDGGGHFDLSANNGNELDSISLNFDQNCGLVNGVSSAPVGNPDVIVLIDSDEEQEGFIPPGNIYDSGQAGVGSIHFSAPAEIHNLYVENPSLVTGRNSFMGLFSGNGDGISMWPSTSSTQAGPKFQLFQTEPDVPNCFVDVPQTSIACPTSMNNYMMDPDTAMGSAVQVPVEHSVQPNNADMNGCLVDNPMVFGGDDPSLQLFLPSQPAGTSMHSDFGDLQDMSNSIHSEDWISLRLGGGGDGDSISGQVEPATANGLNSGHHYANEAPLLLSMNDNMSDSTSTKRQRSESPFRCPRQPLSARPRLNFSID